VRLVLALRTRPGQDHSAELVAAEAAARGAGIADVQVHGRIEAMTDALAAADVVLFNPLRLDGGKADVPLTVLEALATGRPVVATKLPQLAALSDVLVQVPAGAAAEASEAVRLLLTEPVAWQERSQSGRDAVERRFSGKQMCRAYAEIYAELLDVHARRLASHD